jgi:hypothetical protein
MTQQQLVSVQVLKSKSAEAKFENKKLGMATHSFKEHFDMDVSTYIRSFKHWA